LSRLGGDASAREYKVYRRRHLKGRVFLGDASAFLQGLRAASADIVFLDPPFNLGKLYIAGKPHADSLPDETYKAWLTGILNQSIRVLKPGGALFLYHLPRWAMVFGFELMNRLQFRHWIAVSMKNGFVRGRRLYPAHYALLYMTKGDPTIFRRPKLSLEFCRSCGQTVKDYGGYRLIVETKGLNLSDVWDDLSPVRHAREKLRKQNQLPLAFTDRVIEISGSPNMLLVDPFVGSGSSIVSAVRAGMRFAACDVVESNCEVVTNRLAELDTNRGRK
jgi:site-specific DNA-methyltransferase (adenine-specific)